MGFPPFVLKHIPFVLLLAVLNTLAIMAQEGPIGNPAEKVALNVLLTTFYNPTLIGNWTGQPCNTGNEARWVGIQCANGRVNGIVLEGMGLTGELSATAYAFFNLQELSILRFKNNFIRGNVIDLSNNHQIKYIDLSGNELDGPISSSLLSLNLLETLLLQDNRLIGSIPGLNQPGLKVFNVSNNNLEGRIPETPTLQSFGPGSYSGNPRLCGSPSVNSCSFDSFVTAPENDPNNNGVQHNKSSDKSHTHTIPRDIDEEVQQVAVRIMAVEERKELIFFKDEPKFQMGELLRASAEALGQGIVGNSYKAMLHGGSTIVVKRLRDLKPLTNEEFAKLLHPITDLKHPNLLPLHAYYHSQDEKLLLYKYAQKGNLFS